MILEVVLVIILGVKLQNSIVGMMFRDFFRSYCDLAASLDEVVGHMSMSPEVGSNR